MKQSMSSMKLMKPLDKKPQILMKQNETYIFHILQLFQFEKYKC